MVACVFLLVIAAGAIAAGVRYVVFARAMRSYQSAEGEVLSREVAPVQGASTREAQYGDGGGYAPKIRYRYVVAGVTYEGDRLAYAPTALKRSVAEQRAATYPARVTVWFDPAKPADAYLERNTATYGYVVIAIGVTLALGCGLWLIGGGD